MNNGRFVKLAPLSSSRLSFGRDRRDAAYRGPQQACASSRPEEHPTTTSVLEMLRREFPELDVDAITSWDLLAPKRRSLASRRGIASSPTASSARWRLRRRRRIKDYTPWTSSPLQRRPARRRGALLG